MTKMCIGVPLLVTHRVLNAKKMRSLMNIAALISYPNSKSTLFYTKCKIFLEKCFFFWYKCLMKITASSSFLLFLHPYSSSPWKPSWLTQTPKQIESRRKILSFITMPCPLSFNTMHFVTMPSCPTATIQCNHHDKACLDVYLSPKLPFEGIYVAEPTASRYQ